MPLSEQDQNKVNQEVEKLVESIELKGSYYKFRGRCKQCGWQTFKYDEAGAKEMVKRHAQRHAREILSGEPLTGLGPREVPEGEPLPGEQNLDTGRGARGQTSSASEA